MADADDGAHAADRTLRVLVLCAQVGESHLVMARALAAQLESRPEVASVTILNDFNVLGRVLGGYLSRSFEVHLGKVQWSYDLAYKLFAKTALGRALGEQALYRLAGGALQARIAAEHPDLVVSTYPVMNPVLGALRASGRLDCPVAVVVGPAGGLAYWVHAGIDLHLLNYPHALAELRSLVGEVSAQPVRPLVPSEFFEPIDRGQVRRLLDLPARRRVILVSGGGWGAGDLVGAVRACLALPEVHVVVLAGRNEALHRELSESLARDKRVRLLAFSDQMRELLTAADMFVAATAGLSCIEAHLCGCPTVCYGFTIGHVTDNTRALQALGRVRVASSPQQLTQRIAEGLEQGRPAALPPADLPSAADLLVPLARSASGRAKRRKRSP